MGRWIDTDAAYAVLTDYYHHSTDTQHAALREALGRVESVDAVPVVRCKDCIRFRPDDDVWGWCAVSGKMRCKGYCSYGVRKDGEQNDTV